MRNWKLRSFSFQNAIFFGCDGFAEDSNHKTLQFFVWSPRFSSMSTFVYDFIRRMTSLPPSSPPLSLPPASPGKGRRRPDSLTTTRTNTRRPPSASSCSNWRTSWRRHGGCTGRPLQGENPGGGLVL